jgi:release factor glutamine methyltransferase
MADIHDALERATRALDALPHASACLEAELFLAEVLGKDRSYLHAWPERTLSPAQHHAFQALLSRRLAGEPVAYILGHREFWSLDLRITPDVLIPRPETELLVELALAAFSQDRPIICADLGTGSGAVAAAIALERPRWILYATDDSPSALAVAQQNFRRYGLHNVECRRGDWCAALPPGRKFELIVSNPPYVPALDAHLDRGDTRREPRGALSAGSDGLDAIRSIVAQAPGHLASGGLLLMEHGFDQGRAVRTLLSTAGFAEVRTHRDLAQTERVSGGVRP